MLSDMDLVPVQVTLNIVIFHLLGRAWLCFLTCPDYMEGGNTHNRHEWLFHMPPDTLQQLSLMMLLEGGLGSPQFTD